MAVCCALYFVIRETFEAATNFKVYLKIRFLFQSVLAGRVIHNHPIRVRLSRLKIFFYFRSSSYQMDFQFAANQVKFHCFVFGSVSTWIWTQADQGGLTRISKYCPKYFFSLALHRRIFERPIICGPQYKFAFIILNEIIFILHYYSYSYAINALKFPHI